MQVSSIGGSSYQTSATTGGFSKMKQLFQKLGSALDSGSLSDAKDALAQLQKNAPAQASKDNNPLSAKIEALSKALDSGDLNAAKQAYADIKEALSQGPPQGGGKPSGAPPGGAEKSSSSSDSSSSNKTYDKKDINKDGTVSFMEELVYSMKNPDQNNQAADSSNIEGGKKSIDLYV